ncbi:E4 15 kDa [Mastadenovirus porcusquartum]|uniref:E4 15 kDa n=1 Tax=Mastadenovirus porcusquartum TaxID=3241439 RepID=A0A5P9VI25_9ADEN|nr:E4 15 kDa [Porcine mastadenovirus B]QFX65734.1 E4 15 kDa [Porcine mastadenovirus B]
MASGTFVYSAWSWHLYITDVPGDPTLPSGRDLVDVIRSLVYDYLVIRFDLETRPGTRSESFLHCCCMLDLPQGRHTITVTAGSRLFATPESQQDLASGLLTFLGSRMVAVYHTSPPIELFRCFNAFPLPLPGQ